MRGGTYRFQAQSLRKIHVPAPDSISSRLKEHLRSAFRGRDRRAATDAAAEAYGVTLSAGQLGGLFHRGIQLSRS